MKTQKHPYTAPEADLLVVRFEENMCASTDSVEITDWIDGTDFTFIF